MLLILVAWMYAILRLGDRKPGYIISLIGSLGALFIAIGHITGIGGDVVPGEIASASGSFFVWVVFVMGVTAALSLICSAILLFSPAAQRAAASSA